ncbi:hypothetical protein E2542_SST22336 [Spatholobus suberectus]|nr:hypothetical protein E2542_SST22336 [Spatholobus suberectus]
MLIHSASGSPREIPLIRDPANEKAEIWMNFPNSTNQKPDKASPVDPKVQSLSLFKVPKVQNSNNLSSLNGLQKRLLWVTLTPTFPQNNNYSIPSPTL